MQNGQPSCYGQLWDGSNVECAGGADPAYRHPTNGGNRREQCRWFSSCAGATTQGRQSAGRGVVPPPAFSPPIIPTHQLVRHPGVVPPPVIGPPPVPSPPHGAPAFGVPHPQQQPQPQYHQPQPMMVQAPPAPQVQQAVAAGQQHITYAGPVPYTQPQYAYAPAMVPMNQPMQGAQTQSFVMVPEPLDPDVSTGVRLTRTITRSMFKAAGMAFANFWDYHPMG